LSAALGGMNNQIRRLESKRQHLLEQMRWEQTQQDKREAAYQRQQQQQAAAAARDPGTKARQARYDKLYADADEANNMINRINVLEHAMMPGAGGKEPIVPTGQFGTIGHVANKAKTYFGYGDANRARLGDDIKEFGFSTVLKALDNKLGGGVSDADRKALSEVGIGLDRDPRSNVDAMETLKNMEKRSIAMAEFTEKYLEDPSHKLDRNYDAALRKWTAAQPSVLPESLWASVGLNPETGEPVVAHSPAKTNPFSEALKRRGGQ
jgi:hypothetical protein